MEKIEIVLRREQNNRNGIYLNYINGYWYTYEWSAFLLCMLHPEVEVRKCIGVQPDENYAIARVNKKIIKKLKKIILIVLKMTIGRTYNSTKHFIL